MSKNTHLSTHPGANKRNDFLNGADVGRPCSFLATVETNLGSPGALDPTRKTLASSQPQNPHSVLLICSFDKAFVYLRKDLCYLTINCDTGQHSQFLRCSFNKLGQLDQIYLPCGASCYSTNGLDIRRLDSSEQCFGRNSWSRCWWRKTWNQTWIKSACSNILMSDSYQPRIILNVMMKPIASLLRLALLKLLSFGPFEISIFS